MILHTYFTLTHTADYQSALFGVFYESEIRIDVCVFLLFINWTNGMNVFDCERPAFEMIVHPKV